MTPIRNARPHPAADRPLRVLVLYASNRVSGPGRGLVQLAHATRGRADLTICNFGESVRPINEFTESVVAAGLDARVIIQNSAIDPDIFPQSLRMADEEKFDVVQSHGYKTHLLAWTIRHALGIPWLAVAHGWTSEDFKVRLYNVMEKILLSRADTVVAVSPLLHETISRLRPAGRTVTILNAIEQTRFSAPDDGDHELRRAVRTEFGIPPHRPLITVIGRLSPEKGQDLFLEAMRRLTSRGLQPAAILVGEGPMEAELRATADRLGVADLVAFAGFRRDVRPFFEAADVVCLPSRSEGLPNVVLEAHLLRRAVVAFDVGGVSEVIEDGRNGWVVSAMDTAALADALAEALTNPDETQARARVAADTVFPKFAVDTRANAFLAEYGRLLGS